ncbi:hypothetical protein GOZ93_00720 [Agrobacterium vitis]|uniref:hypothetical protein n=1 Tax=Agrobacterium vitis TaxID=373 RepID=UPI0012E80DAD|nr:hypothetical protein [Agrobacterium vitis]MUZ80760.1 hypothetical protein [Agrobacterium vitis]MVA33635.1 hypothetical protein [Agrobacterium vitis]NSY12419.1 hypothetical protein [Agrobacterium vitis]NSY22248.1 hypothetical protein [Agrobacterium vitis]NTA21949.1 hypothetical protein [Agrobacterium vitis]
MNWADYQPGRRVVCVVDFSKSRSFCSIIPEKGRVYTIRAAEMGDCSDGEVVLCLTFVEFVSLGVPTSKYQPLESEWFFTARHFKPLDERRLDQFRQHLTKTPAPFAYGGVDA